MAILVVDDDDDIREVVQEVLRAEGHETQGAANGEEAVRLLQSGLDRPELILLDLAMPVMDGWDFLLWLDDDAILRQTPVAIMSAHPSIERTLEMAQARRGTSQVLPHGGIRVLLPKPLNILRLLSVVSEIAR
jgi:CheY-like chemotaxis protein